MHGLPCGTKLNEASAYHTGAVIEIVTSAAYIKSALILRIIGFFVCTYLRQPLLDPLIQAEGIIGCEETFYAGRLIHLTVTSTTEHAGSLIFSTPFVISAA